jgi:hypothetical protein
MAVHQLRVADYWSAFLHVAGNAPSEKDYRDPPWSRAFLPESDDPRNRHSHGYKDVTRRKVGYDRADL